MDSSSQVFRTLRENIAKLKMQRDQVGTELLNDKKDLQSIQISIQQLSSEIEGKMAKLKDQQRKLAQLQKTITQTQKSYDIIVQTTQKLATALEQQSSHLKSKIRR